MRKLVFIAEYKKDGQIRGIAPAVAGFYGAYTAHKPNMFSVSYNVRETVDHPTAADILPNLERTLDPKRTPIWKLVEDLLLLK